MKRHFAVKLSAVSLIILLFNHTSHATDNSQKMGKTVQAADLLKTPSYQSDIVRELSKDESINIFERRRSWYRVSTSDATNGWLKMLHVRFLATAKRAGELGVKDLLKSVTGQRTQPTDSSGVRGFDEEKLKKASADLTQIALLSQYQVPMATANAFAKKGKLATNKTAAKLLANEVAKESP